MKPQHLIFSLAAIGIAHAAHAETTGTPAATAAPSSAPRLRDPGLDSLSEPERKAYVEALKTVMKRPEVLAARQAAEKAQDDMLKASAKMREVRDSALSAMSPEMPAIVKKVEDARREWAEQQRLKSMMQRLPVAKAAVPASAPGEKPELKLTPTLAPGIPTDKPAETKKN